MFNVFAFLAVLFLVAALAAAGGLVYTQIAKKKPIVGALVRTTFTGNPAVLTSALWGLQDVLSTSLTYGDGYEQDASNALHCDIYNGFGTYSTWVSTGGLEFKQKPWMGQATRMYFGTQTCNVDTDCSVTAIRCGPAAPMWSPTSPNKASFQCPGNSYCNVCGPLPITGSYTNYCANVGELESGHCINSGTTYPLQCIQTTGNQKHCAAFSTVNPSIPFNRATPCSISENYASLCSNFSDTAFADRPFYCQRNDPSNNPRCPTGQTCVPNTSSLSGWCPPNTGCPYQTTSAICSGTIYPNVSLNTEWIAEGRVISVNGKNSNVQWERVQNTYGGIGPSPLYYTGNREDAAVDLNWAYSDCRFIKSTYSGRHASISLALLGDSTRNPSWAYLPDPNRNSATENLLYIGQTTGSIDPTVIQTSVYFRSAWNLRSQNVPNTNLERIWFYSINPMQTTPDVKKAVSLHLGGS